MNNLYFERYAYPNRFIEHPIKENTFLAVVVPIYKEENLLPTLRSLSNCFPPRFAVEVIFVINHPEKSSEDIVAISEQSAETIDLFKKDGLPEHLTFHTIKAYDLPAKQAGVGLARKIGMDEAAFRLNSITATGVIVCFDADSTVETNYLQAIESYFLTKPACKAASIHFEHPLHGGSELNLPITLYELHLRYYVQGLKFSGYPFAFHTIGSSMAVRSSVYQKQGGMNQRKAGEDFYFLHKIIPLGGFGNIGSTKVIPSARKSDRVPFGTGRAMSEHEAKEKDLTLSYNFFIFQELKMFFDSIKADDFPNQCNKPITHFIQSNNFGPAIFKIKQQSKDSAHFRERFFQWFNGFKALKLVHFLRDHYYPDQPLVQSVARLFGEIPELAAFATIQKADKQLLMIREYERSSD